MQTRMNISALFVCLFVLGFNVSLILFQSHCDGTCMTQRVLPRWNAPVAGTWQEHPTQSHYKLTPGRQAIFPSIHILMPSVSKGATGTIFLRVYDVLSPNQQFILRACLLKAYDLGCCKSQNEGKGGKLKMVDLVTKIENSFTVWMKIDCKWFPWKKKNSEIEFISGVS